MLASLYRKRGSKSKVFGIGMGKTGTTSLERAFIEMGYRVGQQPIFERHFDSFAAGEYSAFLEDVRAFEAFQDMPFCIPGTYKLIFDHFPYAKFVLTIRASADQWYRSLCRFHTRLFGQLGALPTESDLASADYISNGWLLRAQQFIFSPPPGQPYDRQTLINVYETHLRDVLAFFAKRPSSLLVLDVAQPDAFTRLTAFLDVPIIRKSFPHLNKAA